MITMIVGLFIVVGFCVLVDFLLDLANSTTL